MTKMEWIRQTYNVPAYLNAEVEINDDTAKFIMGFIYVPKRGIIVGSYNHKLIVRLEHNYRRVYIHPADSHLTYL